MLAPLLALILGVSSVDRLWPRLPLLLSLLAGVSFLAALRAFDRRLLTVTALLASLMLGIVTGTRIADTGHRSIVKDSAVSWRADAVFTWHTARFVRAVMLAETDVLDESDRDHYRRAGLTHLLAISGLNVAILAGFFWCAVRGIAGGGAVTEYAAAAATSIYIFGIGAPPSALRAGLMAAAVFLARAWKRPAHILNVLLGAAFVTVAFDPAALFDVGFQLSYAATLGLIFWSRPLESWMPARSGLLGRLIAVSAAAQLPTLPIMMSVFGEFAPIAFLANIAVVPIFALLMPLIVLALCGVPGCAVLTEILHGRTTAIISTFADMPGSSYLIDRPPLAAVVALLGLSALPILPNRTSRMVAVCALALIAFGAVLAHRVEDGLYLVRDGSRAGAMRVDAGQAELLDPGLSAATWRRALSDLRIRRIERVITATPISLSHGHAFSLVHDRPVDAWEIDSRWETDAEVEARISRLKRAGAKITRRAPNQGPIIAFHSDIIALGQAKDTRATIRIEMTREHEILVRDGDGSVRAVVSDRLQVMP